MFVSWIRMGISGLEYLLNQVDNDRTLNGSLILACDANGLLPII